MSPSSTCQRASAALYAVIAAGFAAHLHSFTTPPVECGSAIHLGVRVGIVLALVIAVINLFVAAGAIVLGSIGLQLLAALSLGIAILVGLDQITAPVDRQIANWAIFGGLAAAATAKWFHTYGKGANRS